MAKRAGLFCFFGAVLFSALQSTPREAQACSAPDCRRERALLPPTIPANTPAIYWEPAMFDIWQPPSDQVVDESVTRVVRFFESGDTIIDGSSVPLEVIEYPPPDAPKVLTYRMSGYVVAFSEPLEENALYRFDRPGYCSGSDPTSWSLSTDFETGPASPYPGNLGQLVVDPVLQTQVMASAGLDYVGACSSSVGAVAVHYEVRLSAEAEPWRDLLVYWSVVDGVAHRNEQSLDDAWDLNPSPASEGKDYVWVTCDERVPSGTNLIGSVEPGVHSIQLRAWLPGSDVIVTSDTVDVELRCPEVEDPTTPDASAPDAMASDASVSDASVPDASTPVGSPPLMLVPIDASSLDPTPRADPNPSVAPGMDAGTSAMKPTEPGPSPTMTTTLTDASASPPVEARDGVVPSGDSAGSSVNPRDAAISALPLADALAPHSDGRMTFDSSAPDANAVGVNQATGCDCGLAPGRSVRHNVSLAFALLALMLTRRRTRAADCPLGATGSVRRVRPVASTTRETPRRRRAAGQGAGGGSTHSA